MPQAPAGALRRACHHGAMLKTLKDLFDHLLPPAPGVAPQAAEHVLHVPQGAYVHARLRAEQGR